MSRSAVAALAVLALGSFALAGDPAPGPAPAVASDPLKLVEALKGKDEPARLDAARQAKDVQDDKLLPPLVALLDTDDLSLRHAAIEALGHRTSPDAQKKAASALATHLPRVAKKPDGEVELIATAQALGELAQPSALDALMSGIELDSPSDVVEARLMAVSNLPSADAIDALIQFLAKQGRGKGGPQRESCRSALRAATGENLGNDPDTWRSWWKDARKSFDFAAAAERRAAERQKKDDNEQRKKERKEKKDGGGGDGGKK